MFHPMRQEGKSAEENHLLDTERHRGRDALSFVLSVPDA